MESTMARSAVELDFFRMEKEITSAKPPPQKKLFDRRRSFRDIQGVISKLNPELLKSVIASGSVDRNTISVPSTPKHDENLFPALPVYVPSLGISEITPETVPMTIFYNGTVAVFDVPRFKAENILKFAEGGVSNNVESAHPETQLLETLNGAGLPIARRKSLKTFLEKRKERLTLVSPYGDFALSGKKTSGDRD